MLKAIILAGGKGTRMNPLTLTRPKPLLKVVNKSIIEHNLEQLRGTVKEVIIVIGYRGEMIKEEIGDSYKGLKINYVRQEVPLGTGDAAQKALSMIDDSFLLLNGDDLYAGEDIKKIIKRGPSILLSRVDEPSSFGVVECQGDLVKSMVEKPDNPPKDALVNTGLYFLDKSIFNFKIEKSSRGELEFTDYIKRLIEEKELYYRVASRWIPLSYPWNLLEANDSLLKRSFISRRATIKKGVVIEGPVFIGSGSVIGPNSFIRGKTVIGEGCHIGGGVEIKNSIIGNGTRVPHLSYIGDSIIGEDCNIGGGSIVANLRFDEREIEVEVKGEKVNSRRKKLGAIIGDRVKIGVNCSIMPGTVIDSDVVIGSASIVRGKVDAGVTLYNRVEQLIKKNE